MAGQILGGQGILSNPLIATLSPDQQQNLVQLQQRQAIGQAMLAQGMTPLDTSNAQVGGMAYHVSPLNGFAKLLQAYVGNKLSMDSMGQQAGLMSQMVGKPFLGGDNTQAQSTDSGGGPTVSLPPSSANDTAPMQGVSAGLGLNTPTPIQLGQAMGGQQPAAHYGPMTLPGKTPQESMQIFAMVGPDAYSRMLTQWAAPTDATRMALAAGQDTAQANAGALFKNNYVAPNQGTPGTVARDPRTNMPLYYSPDVPKGAQPVFGASGNLAGVAPMQGSAAAIANAAGAEARGRAQYELHDTFNPTTNTPTVDTVFNIANRANGTGQGVQTAPALGATPAANAMAEGAAKQGLSLQQQAEGAPMRKSYLEQMDNALGQFAGGKGADWSLYTKSMINRTLPTGMQPFDPKSISSQEDFNKQSTQYALQQFQTLGSAGSDNSMQTTLHANPNQLLSNLGNHQIIQLLKGNEDAIDVKNRAYQQWLSQGNSPKDYGQFQTQFNHRFDPRIFQSVYMAPDERGQLVKGMTAAEQQAFRQKYNYAVQNGWIPDPRGGQ
ncbi:hypothetical protein OYT13_15775 [Pandoraea sp. XJJ-1]|uniref:hypothetical protein n=1 Tax=Pandoraea sp. XJJ-1 TaxID=3002643 RepID=UPI00228128DF|nr:hypothetical protein [Pandoraea sp. XJJ-1]WAL81310.1 hypothetical protein OYT13_15775 [Pandoraea sp. XJJ-1]